MGGGTPKALRPLLNRPILHWTLRSLESCPSIHSIILVVPPGTESHFNSARFRKEHKKVYAAVAGGRERTDSTRLAMKALPRDADWVGIHDAARPFVTSAQLQAVFRAAKFTGCAILAVPSKDTVKIARQGAMKIDRTVPRERCWLAQTPQVFRRNIVEKLHAKRRKAKFTDDASIAESMGLAVTLVPGSYENIKITTPQDLELAQKILKKRRKNG